MLIFYCSAGLILCGRAHRIRAVKVVHVHPFSQCGHEGFSGLSMNMFSVVFITTRKAWPRRPCIFGSAALLQYMLQLRPTLFFFGVGYVKCPKNTVRKRFV